MSKETDMKALVLGPENSGKSAFAETLSLDMDDEARYYIATMSIKDEEGIKRIEKHRRQRAGKGFVTLEIPFSVSRALEKINSPSTSCVLLECMSNLVGNEMYDNAGRPWYKKPGCLLEEEFCDILMKDICFLAEGVKDLVVVSSSYPLHDCYDERTLGYIRFLDAVNERLKTFSDRIFRSGIDF